MTTRAFAGLSRGYCERLAFSRSLICLPRPSSRTPSSRSSTAWCSTSSCSVCRGSSSRSKQGLGHRGARHLHHRPRRPASERAGAFAGLRGLLPEDGFRKRGARSYPPCRSSPLCFSLIRRPSPQSGSEVGIPCASYPVESPERSVQGYSTVRIRVDRP